MKNLPTLILIVVSTLSFSLETPKLLANDALRMTVIKIENAPAVEASGESLAEAAAKGRTTTVQNLLAQGISPDSRDARGVPAIALAAKNGFADTVQALAQGKAQVNATDNDGATALILASNGGHTKTVKALLEAEANANLKRNDGESALSLATKNKFAEIINLLKAAGAK